jgi:hypothetical protein
MVPTPLRHSLGTETGFDIDPRPVPDTESHDPFLEFAAEIREAARDAPPHLLAESFWVRRHSTLVICAALAVGIIVGGVASAALPYLGDRTGSASSPAIPTVVTKATATITSNPPGAVVGVDGQAVGITPLSLSLPVGAHLFDLRIGDSTRSLALAVEAGKIVSHHVDFAAPSAPALEISSDPPGAFVSVDDVRKGITPLSVAELSPGPHRVSISSGSTTLSRTVEVKAGATASVVVSLAPVSAPTGWVSIETPFEVQVSEGSRALGTGSAWRLRLPVGRHELDVANRALDFQARTTVDVVPDRVVPLKVSLPHGSLSVNALPWADVWVDGKPVGTTPLGNLVVPVGTHELVWRHPQFGERRQIVIVSATVPTRIGIDWAR